MKPSPFAVPVLAVVALGTAACSDHEGFRFQAPPDQVLSVAFETRAEIPVGVGDVADAAMADFNGDGRLDLVVTSLLGKVQVLLGAGNGTFTMTQSFDAPGRPFLVRSGDLDGDGSVDFVVLRGEAEMLTGYLNDGRANFRVAGDSPVGLAPQDFLLFDVDRDRVPDVIACSLRTPEVRVFGGDRSGTFAVRTPIRLPTGTAPYGIATADLDIDGYGDIVVADFKGDRILVLYGDDPTAPIEHPVGRRPVAAAVGDIDNDDLPDIVVSNLEDNSLTLLRRRAMRQYASETLPVGGAPGNVLIDDLTADGIDDMVVCLFSRAGCELHVGQQDGSLAPPLQFSVTGVPFRPLAGQINSTADALKDLLVTGSYTDRVSVIFGTAVLPATAYNYESGLRSAEIVAAADFDGDGVADVAVTGNTGPAVAILCFTDDPTTRSRTLEQRAVVNVGSGSLNMVRGDFNRDGKPDLAVALAGGVKLLANRSSGPGSFAFDVIPPAPTEFLVESVGPFEIDCGDLDGDGLDDLVVAATTENKLVIRRASGDFAYSAAPLEIAVSGAPLGLAVADYSGDGRPDIAVSRSQAGFVNIYRNDGGGSFSLLLESPVGSSPTYLRAADFNRDGRSDLVVSNTVADSVTVLVARDRLGVFNVSDLVVGRRPTALLARDLNQDANPDILVASLEGEDFWVLLGDGRGGFSVQTRFPGTYLALSADLADANGDGLPDLAIGSIGSRRVPIYRNLSRLVGQ